MTGIWLLVSHGSANAVIRCPPGRICGRAIDQLFKRARGLAEIDQHPVDRQMFDLLGPINFRFGRGKIIVLRHSSMHGRIGDERQLRAKRIVDAVEPDEEEASRHTARVPITLFLKAPHFADTGPCRHGYHGRQGWVMGAREGQLPFSARRAT